MNTYRTLFSLALLLGMFAGFAQETEDERRMNDKIEAYRAQYITEQLDLTPEEAQKFWPIYNQYRKELDAIHGQRIGSWSDDGHHGPPDLNSMTEGEIYQMLRQDMDRQQKMVDLRKKYFEKFDEVLPIRKVAELYRAEIEFQRKMIRRLKEHERGNHQ